MRSTSDSNEINHKRKQAAPSRQEMLHRRILRSRSSRGLGERNSQINVRTRTTTRNTPATSRTTPAVLSTGTSPPAHTGDPAPDVGAGTPRTPQTSFELRTTPAASPAARTSTIKPPRLTRKPRDPTSRDFASAWPVAMRVILYFRFRAHRTPVSDKCTKIAGSWKERGVRWRQVGDYHNSGLQLGEGKSDIGHGDRAGK